MLAVSEGLIDATNASHLKFSGITFQYSTWLAPSVDADGRSGGFVEVQSGGHYVRQFEPEALQCGLIDVSTQSAVACGLWLRFDRLPVIN